MSTRSSAPANTARALSTCVREGSPTGSAQLAGKPQFRAGPGLGGLPGGDGRAAQVEAAAGEDAGDFVDLGLADQAALTQPGAAGVAAGTWRRGEHHLADLATGLRPASTGSEAT